MFRNPYGSEGSVVTTQPVQGDRSMARQAKPSNPSTTGEYEPMSEELWQACAGPQRTLPSQNSLVSYFTQGHLEQVESCNNDADIHVPKYNYKVPPEITCNMIDVRLQAQESTDEVLALVCLMPCGSPPQEFSSSVELSVPSKEKSIFFTKILTVSDTSTHGGFSVPRRGAEECFPPLDKSHDNPIQDLWAKDLHGKLWKFRHLFRGQPKRHLLTTGWSVFVAQKRLRAGDSVLFLKGEDKQLRIAVRLAPRSQKQTPLVTEPTMALGVLEAAAHAARESARLSLIYNPRSCPSPYIIPYQKYAESKKVHFVPGQRVKSEFAIGDAKSVGVAKNTAGARSRSRFEAEDSSDARLLGTIVEISDHDPQRWPGSPWRSIKVKWDESCTARQERVSPWEITPYVPRASQPSSFAAKRRPKPAPPQLQPVDMDPPSMSITTVPYGRLPPQFATEGTQGVFGPRSIENQQENQQEFRMRIFEQYRNGIHEESQSSPRLCNPLRNIFQAQSYVKEEPLGEAGLHFGVLPGGDAHGSNRSCSTQQPSREWLSPRMSSIEITNEVAASRIDVTALSMSNLAPAEVGNTRSSNHSACPMWGNQSHAAPPAQGEHRVRIFGISLDRPATTETRGDLNMNEDLNMQEDLNLRGADVDEDKYEEMNGNMDDGYSANLTSASRGIPTLQSLMPQESYLGNGLQFSL